jgi:hypothetical protein
MTTENTLTNYFHDNIEDMPKDVTLTDLAKSVVYLFMSYGVGVDDTKNTLTACIDVYDDIQTDVISAAESLANASTD